MFTLPTHRMMFIHAIPCDLFKTNYEHMKNCQNPGEAEFHRAADRCLAFILFSFAFFGHVNKRSPLFTIHNYLKGFCKTNMFEIPGFVN